MYPVELVLAFGVVLLLAVSLSGLSARTVLSSALMFLLAGALIGDGGLGLVSIQPTDPIVSTLADLALFTVLFTDGQRASVPALRENWRLSGRALGLAMPLTMLGIAVPAHFLVGLDWPTALLLGAILSPTDPVFAAAIVGRGDVPLRLRRLLNVESGLNDGLALPFVLIFLATASEQQDQHFGTIALELGLGLALGIGISVAMTLAWRLRVFTAEPRLQVLGPLGIGVAVYAACHLTHANPYLAAFVAGSALATMDKEVAHRYEPLGDILSELTKFAALLVFGALITPSLLGDLSLGGWAFAVLAILLVRPAVMLLSLIRTQLPAEQRLTAAWFGPKGFASVVYALLVSQSGIPQSQTIFELAAVTIGLSIVLHSSTDVLIAKKLRAGTPENLPTGSVREGGDLQ